MSYCLRPIIVLFVLLGTVGPGSAQGLFDTTARPSVLTDSLDPLGATREMLVPNGIQLAFDHLLSLYEWRGAFNYVSLPSYGFEYKPEYVVHFDGDSRLRQENSSLTTEATGLISAAQPITNGGLIKPFVMLYGTSYLTSSRSTFAANASLITKQVDGFGIAGIRSRLPESDVDLSVGAGIARQSQPNTSAYGVIVRGDASAPQEQIGETSILRGSASADERFFHERGQRFSNDRLALQSVTNFGQEYSNGHNEALLDLGFLRRDFFFDIDSATPSAKQERKELSMLLVDSLQYPILGDHLTGNLSVEFEPRSVSRRSDISNSLITRSSSSALSTLLVPNDVSSLRIAANGRFTLTPASLTGLGAQVQMRYEERSESVRLIADEISGIEPAAIRKLSNTLEQASFSSRATQSMLAINYAPGMRDSLELDGNIRLLSYDTPSLDNQDDHDELVTSARLGYNRRYSDELTSLLEVRASRTHLVYLSSERSAQNNITRSLGLATQASYAGDSYYGILRGEVFANYTVLDYIDSLPLLQSVGSYVLRGVSLQDTSMFSLGFRPFDGVGPLTLEGNFDLRVNERGSYHASAFTERRSTRITELSGSLLLGVSSTGGAAPWSIKAGVRGFGLSRYGQSEVSLTSLQNFSEIERQSRIGPFALLYLSRANNSGPRLSGSIWYAVVTGQIFDAPAFNRSHQVESHLQVEWRF